RFQVVIVLFAAKIMAGPTAQLCLHYWGQLLPSRPIPIPPSLPQNRYHLWFRVTPPRPPLLKKYELRVVFLLRLTLYISDREITVVRLQSTTVANYSFATCAGQATPESGVSLTMSDDGKIKYTWVVE